MGMGLFDFLKKIAGTTDGASVQRPQNKTKIVFTETINEKTSTLKTSDNAVLPTDFKHLTKEGELPFGWVYRNREFTDKIQSEYSYFLNLWLDNRSKSPKEQYQALKTFVLYLEDVERLCKSKGECFEFWFYEILASKDYIAKRKAELEVLTANLDELQANFGKRNAELSTLDERIIKMLIEHPDVLQSDFVKMFDPLVKNVVSEKLYFMEKNGKLERTKSGRSYILHYKG